MHEGVGLTLPHKPEEYIKHHPEACQNCNELLENITGDVAGTRYEIDVKIAVKVISHEAVSVVCPKCSTVTTGNFPANIQSSMQYGNDITALAVVLNTMGMVSINRTHEILNSVLGVPISTGTISSMIRKCADSVTEAVGLIKEGIIKSAVTHFDETGMRVDKKLHWAHNASTDKLTYITIALCNAHLLRELTSVFENTSQSWATEMKDLLLDMKTVKEQSIEDGKTAISSFYTDTFSSRYDSQIIFIWVANI